MLFDRFTMNTFQLLNLDTDDLTKESRYWVDNEFILSNYELFSMLEESTLIYLEVIEDSLDIATIALLILLVITFPIVIFGYVLLRPVENHIRQENARTMKMLLMIPTDLIEQVPTIKDFLETGEQENTEQKLKYALDQNIARSKSIIN